MERENLYYGQGWYKVLRIAGWVVLGATAIVGIAFLFGYFVMILWNWIMPELFGLAQISFWKAFGIILLARLIFGGFKHSRAHYSRNYKSRPFRGWGKSRCKGESMKDWRYFDDYWTDEGEKSFNEYIERKKAQPQ